MVRLVLCGDCAPEPAVWGCWHMLYRVFFSKEGNQYDRVQPKWVRGALEEAAPYQIWYVEMQGEEKMRKFNQQVGALPSRGDMGGGRMEWDHEDHDETLALQSPTAWASWLLELLEPRAAGSCVSAVGIFLPLFFSTSDD